MRTFTVTTTPKDRLNRTDKAIIKGSTQLGEYIKDVEVVSYDFDVRVFNVTTTREWGKRHRAFY